MKKFWNWAESPLLICEDRTFLLSYPLEKTWIDFSGEVGATYVFFYLARRHIIEEACKRFTTRVNSSFTKIAQWWEASIISFQYTDVLSSPWLFNPLFCKSQHCPIQHHSLCWEIEIESPHLSGSNSKSESWRQTPNLSLHLLVEWCTHWWLVTNALMTCNKFCLSLW